MNPFKLILKGSIAGLISGLVLGIFLRTVESNWGIKVYTLLLNVDYIPILRDIPFNESIHFSFHLIISVVLSVLLLYFITKYKWTNAQIVYKVILICLVLGTFLYPTTLFSHQTPPINSVLDISFWLVGHLLYGGILSVFLLNKA
ncbi:hypothetical protein [Bacillus thuringiensis]|uniref:hypothetical protein n=1 Tax=Bacillus thuringiensis TaxID=1428 RepID=UPI002E1810BC|nr:hypothetical protein [Bacillus thuringiensis]